MGFYHEQMHLTLVCTLWSVELFRVCGGCYRSLRYVFG
jgi:hypothetical protein